MTVCENCGYRRQEADGGSLAVCPKCDMPYEWSAAGARVPAARDVSKEEARAMARALAPGPRAVSGRAGDGRPAAADDGVADTMLFAIVLALGCFVPLMSVPIVGSVTATQLRFSDGYILLALAALAVWLAYSGKVRAVRWPGFLAAAIVVLNFAVVIYRVQEVKAEVRSQLAGNPFTGLAEAMIQSVQLQWGWVPLMVGAIGLVAVGYGKRLPLRR